jgi:hypothetical protein
MGGLLPHCHRNKWFVCDHINVKSVLFPCDKSEDFELGQVVTGSSCSYICHCRLVILKIGNICKSNTR